MEKIIDLGFERILTRGQKQNAEDGEEKEQQKQPQQSEEEKLAKEEAESILNALQANQKNLMKKKYKAKNRIKLEKDW